MHSCHIPLVQSRAASTALAELRKEWQCTDPANAFQAVKERLPTSLRTLGVKKQQLDTVVKLFSQAVHKPRALNLADLTHLVEDAYLGRCPSQEIERTLLPREFLVKHHRERHAQAGCSLEAASSVVICIHGRGSNSDEFLGTLMDMSDRDAGMLACPQASENSWYPKGFEAPVSGNQPYIGDTLRSLTIYLLASKHVSPNRIIMVSFSQGACALLTWLLSHDGAPRALLAFSGAATTKLAQSPHNKTKKTTVYLSVSENDSWVPKRSVERTIELLKDRVVKTSAHFAQGSTHKIYKEDFAMLRSELEAIKSHPVKYQSGFNQTFQTEAIEVLCPRHRIRPDWSHMGFSQNN